MGVLPELDPDCVRLYDWLLRLPHGAARTSTALAERTGLSETEVVRSLARLRALRLVTGDRAVAVDPRVAADQLFDPLEERLRERERVLEQDLRRARELRRGLTDLGPLYREATRPAGGNGGREDDGRDHGNVVLRGQDAVRAALLSAAHEARREVVTVRPGGTHRPEQLREAVHRDLAMVRRGVRLTGLYQHAARANLALKSYAARVSSAGAEIRTARELFAGMSIFDQRVAYLPVPLPRPYAATGAAAPGGGTEEVAGTLVVRDPTVLAHLRGLFELLWQSATPLLPEERGYGGVAGDDMRRAVAELLAQGHKDETVARRLGISVRSCRRHIAALSEELGAENRFQAGVRAVRAGLLHPRP